MNTWLFATSRRQYNRIKSVIKMCAFCLFLLHKDHEVIITGTLLFAGFSQV